MLASISEQMLWMYSCACSPLPFSMQAEMYCRWWAQVVAVGASLLLGGAQGLDFPHRLTDLQLEVVPGLFQLAAGALLCRDPEDKDDIRHAAHEGHEFHRRLIALGEKVGVDAGHIIEKVACQRHYAEQKLHRARIPGKAAGRRGNIAQQYRQQRQRDHNLDAGCSQSMPGTIAMTSSATQRRS